MKANGNVAAKGLPSLQLRRCIAHLFDALHGWQMQDTAVEKHHCSNVLCSLALAISSPVRNTISISTLLVLWMREECLLQGFGKPYFFMEKML